MSDTDDNDDESTVIYSKPHLDPRAVVALASSIPHCSRVKPPNHRAALASEKDGKSDLKVDTGGGSSYFSHFSRKLQGTFSAEDKSSDSPTKQKQKESQYERNEVLSFLVSDAHSIEQLAAEAEWKHTSTSELEGAGIARIDVYCQSGTVITCRVIKTKYAEGDHEQTTAAMDVVVTSNAKSNDNEPMTRGSSFLHMLPTPKKGNVSEMDARTKNNNNNNGNNGANRNNVAEGTQVRRIIKRNCSLQTLRKILEQPPKLPEVNDAIISMVPDHYNEDGGDTEEDDSDASTASKRMRKRRVRRRGSNKRRGGNNNNNNNKDSKFSQLSREQQTFLKQQRCKYERRVRKEEKTRERVGNAILAGGGIMGISSETGFDLTAVKSMSVDESTTTAGSVNSKDTVSMSMSAHAALSNEDDGTTATMTSCHSPTSDAYHAQKAVQDKIEIADMGLAILMGEAQRLERIMHAMKENERNNEGGGGGGGGGESSTTGSRSTKDNRNKGGARGGNGNETDRSFSTFRSTDRSGTDGDSDDSSTDSEDTKDDDDDDDDNSEEARKLARLMQGCEVEYSFPSEFHDELEAALMGEVIKDDKSSSSSSTSDSDSEEEWRRTSKIVSRRGRGRSPPKGGGGGKQHTNQKMDAVSPIVAVPTNGEGCVLLRENGAFDVIGKIPEVLQQKLFKSGGPLPDHVALGTFGRYYVHFTDGSFYFYGPPSLSKILIKGNKKVRRGRGKRGEQGSVASVAFGKELDDFFVVRSDGSWEAHGNLPVGLDNLMKTRKGRADLMWVGMGVDEEWCVRSKNGRVWWEGVSDEADEALADLLAEDGENELKFIDFGKDETYFLLHK